MKTYNKKINQSTMDKTYQNEVEIRIIRKIKTYLIICVVTTLTVLLMKLLFGI